MVPSWLTMLGGIAPVLLLISIGLAIFGIHKLLGYFASVSEAREEEERKRLEFIKKMNIKIQDAKLKP